MELGPLQKQWVATLYSKPPQTRVALGIKNAKGESFCVMGVACMVLHKNGVIEDVFWEDTMSLVTYLNVMGTTGVIPMVAAQLIGLKTSVGLLPKGHVHNSLQQAGDRGVDFAEIASIIEQNKDFLFFRSV